MQAEQCEAPVSESEQSHTESGALVPNTTHFQSYFARQKSCRVTMLVLGSFSPSDDHCWFNFRCYSCGSKRKWSIQKDMHSKNKSDAFRRFEIVTHWTRYSIPLVQGNISRRKNSSALVSLSRSRRLSSFLGAASYKSCTKICHQNFPFNDSFFPKHQFILSKICNLLLQLPRPMVSQSHVKAPRHLSFSIDWHRVSVSLLISLFCVTCFTASLMAAMFGARVQWWKSARSM